MACRGMHSWTFSGLIGAFVDLAIAYLLLCASTLAFFASKFLGFFGLCLPCPCDGLVGNPSCNCCLHRLLVDFPVERVYSVQLSVKNKFPFDSHSAEEEEGRNYQLSLKLVRECENYVDGPVEMEGEASCSSISGTGKSENVVERDLVLRTEPGTVVGVVNSSVHAKEGRFDLKGKGVMDQRPRSGTRCRRKCVADYGKVSSTWSDDSSSADAARSTISYNRRGCEVFEFNSVPADSGVEADRFHYDDEDWIMRNIRARSLNGSELTEACDENKPTEKDPMAFEGIKSDAQGGLGVDCNEKNAIRILEQALEEEHAARAALYLELEKERSAAASAADEAMAMILRLQEEKASIGMEARQYQRIIEEKTSYDAEEMNILKEIIVRRETEKHFLEKEVEAYRQMIYDGNQQLQDDDQSAVNTQREQLASSLEPGEDAILMLQQLCEAIDKKVMVKDGNSVNEASSIDKQNCALVVREKLRTSGWGESEFSKQEDLYNQFSRISGSQVHDCSQKTIPLSGEQKAQNANAQQCNEMTMGTMETHNVTDFHILHNDENLEHRRKEEYQERKYPGNMVSDMVPHVHDVHFIDGESSFCTVVMGNENERLLENDLSNVHRINDLPSKDSEIQRMDSETDPGVNRNSSEMAAGLPPLGSSKGAKPLLSDQRRNPKSEVDNERLKIDSEVVWLRERLRIIQEGREKLNFSVEHREREKIQLQLLEDIACQLREIRLLTEPGNAVRQASLPLPSSKVMSKKRRHRSASLGVQKSS